MEVASHILQVEVGLSSEALAALHDYRDADMDLNIMLWSKGWEEVDRWNRLDQLRKKRIKSLSHVRVLLAGKEAELDRWIDDEQLVSTLAYKLFRRELYASRGVKPSGVPADSSSSEAVLRQIRADYQLEEQYDRRLAREKEPRTRAVMSETILLKVQLAIHIWGREKSLSDPEVARLVGKIKSNLDALNSFQEGK